MILIEMIFSEEKKRHFAQVDETMTVGEFKKKIEKKTGINNMRIHWLPGAKNIRDDMPIYKTGMWNGSGVVIENGSS